MAGLSQIRYIKDVSGFKSLFKNNGLTSLFVLVMPKLLKCKIFSFYGSNREV
jgi:hypothetical protein